MLLSGVACIKNEKWGASEKSTSEEYMGFIYNLSLFTFQITINEWLMSTANIYTYRKRKVKFKVMKVACQYTNVRIYVGRDSLILASNSLAKSKQQNPYLFVRHDDGKKNCSARCYLRKKRHYLGNFMLRQRIWQRIMFWYIIKWSFF